MGQVIEAELKLKYGNAIKEVEELKKELQEVKESFEASDKAAKDSAKSSKGFGKALGAIGKAGGVIFLLEKAFGLFQETLGKNQTIIDATATATEFLSIAFNDLFNFLQNNVGAVTGFFKSIFDDPKQSLIDFANAFKRNIQERFESYLDTLGFLASAVKKVFSGDFAGAMEDVKNAGKESLDVLTGVDGTFEKSVETVGKVTKAVTEYTKSTYNSAKATVELNKEVQIADALQQGLVEKYDLQAEQQRQIRDDESKSIEERIKANEKLGEILDKQEEEMLKNVKLRVQAAQIEFDKNQDNIEAKVALIEAENELAAVQAQVTGFRSEQLTNINSLLRESVEIEQEVADAKAAIQDAAMDNAMRGFQLLGKVAGKNRALQAAAIIGENASGIARQVINTRAANAKVTAKYALLPGGVALAAAEKAINNVSLGIGIATSVLATSQALKALKSGGSATKPNINTSEPTPAQAPAFNIVGQSTTDQLADVLASQGQQPIQAYVVSNDVSTAQELDRNIIEGASIG